MKLHFLLKPISLRQLLEVLWILPLYWLNSILLLISSPSPTSRLTGSLVIQPHSSTMRLLSYSWPKQLARYLIGQLWWFQGLQLWPQSTHVQGLLVNPSKQSIWIFAKPWRLQKNALLTIAHISFIDFIYGIFWTLFSKYGRKIKNKSHYMKNSCLYMFLIISLYCLRLYTI